MAENFLKIFYFFSAGIAFGFGAAMVLLKNVILSGFWHWTLASFILALGGFLLALGFLRKKRDNDSGDVSQKEEKY
ncbi:MAG: hypothetical protein WC926_04075 [Candidatus Paceibacterota bacterium]|jgi:D-alanyl-lipoteichoic acid acyltransferase DltB (MBOAT superfamily)